MDRSASEPFLSGRGSSQFSNRHESKIAYKRKEQDAELLQNRIHLLRQEEQKMQKKTQETKQKIKTILELRNRHDNRDRDQETLKQAKEKELQEMREENAKKNNQHKKKLMQVGKIVLNQKRESRRIIMDEKKDIAVRSMVQREGDLMLKAAQRDQIRNAEISLAQRRMRAQLEKEQEALQRMEDRDFAQKQALREKEDFIAQMEREEIELIQRLEKAQERQKAVHAQLEDLLIPGAQSQSALPPIMPRATPSSRQKAVSDGYATPIEVGQGSARWSEKGVSGTLSRSSSVGALSRTSARGSLGGSRATITPTSCRASTPPDAKATYTTVNGITIEVGPEESLDLFNLLNGE
jgi:hypothetical protein